MAHNLIKDIVSGVWAIEEQYAIQMMDVVAKILAGENVENLSTGAQFQTLNTPMSSKGIGVIPIKGVIRKTNFCGDPGLISMENQLKQYGADDSIGAIILDVDSPGGEASYLNAFVETMRTINKPIVGLYSSLAASAGYYIISNCDYVYSNSKTDRVGSIGTLISLYAKNPDYIANPENERKYILTTVNATLSTDKNREYEEAVEGKFDLIRSQTLDPFNLQFHEDVRAGRPNIDKSVFTGKMYFPAEAEELGMIDGVKNMDEVIDFTFELIEKQNQPAMGIFNSKKKKITMNFYEKVSKITGKQVNTQEEFLALDAEDMAKVSEATSTDNSATPAVTNEALTRSDVQAMVTEMLEKRTPSRTDAQVNSLALTIVTAELAKDAAPRAKTGEVLNEDDEAPKFSWNDEKSTVNKSIAEDLGE